MTDYKTHGPLAWCESHSDVALATLEALISIDEARRADTTIDIIPLLKDVAKLCDGELTTKAPFPSIFLSSRHVLNLGPKPRDGSQNKIRSRERANLDRATTLIIKKAFRSICDNSQGHELALGLLYHLRIMKIARDQGQACSASQINPADYETHILADSFAARQITRGYRDGNGSIIRQGFNKSHSEFRRRFNFVEAFHREDNFKLENGKITVKQKYPLIINESLINTPIGQIIDHPLANNNGAIITGITVTKDHTVFTTNSRSARNLTAFKLAA